MADLMTFAIPFILIFAVAYGGLEVAGVMKNKRVNALIAIAVAFFAISSDMVVGIISAILPYVAILFIVVFIIGFLLSPLRSGEEKKKDPTLIAMIAILAFVFLAGQGQEWLTSYLPSLAISSENFLYMAGLVFVIVLLYAAYTRGGE
jgi:uncharacterized membrane protein